MRQIQSEVVVSTPSQNLWSQAYSTLNLYIVLSVEGDDAANVGRDLLARIQREYFALDEKTLGAIEEACSRVFEEFEQDQVSFALLSIDSNEARIVTLNEGDCALFRGEVFGLIATGNGQVSSYSGVLKPGDSLILGNRAFFKLFPAEVLSTLSLKSVSDAAEAIATKVHSSKGGCEAAVVIKLEGGDEENEDLGTVIEEAEAGSGETIFERITRIVEPYYNKGVNFVRFRKKMSVFAVLGILFVLILGFLIFREVQSRRDGGTTAKFEQILQEVDVLKSDAKASSGIDPSIAIDSYKKAISILESSKSTFEGTSYSDDVDELIEEIKKLLDEVLEGEAVDLIEVGGMEFEAESVGVAGDQIVVVGTKVGMVSVDGEVGEIVDVEGSEVAVGDSFIYVYSDGEVATIDRGNYSTEVVIEKGRVKGIGAFGANVYLLFEDDLMRYSPPNYEGVSYFSENSLSNASSVAIDGAVYIYDREIKKFLRGKKEEFENDFVSPLGSRIKLYTSDEVDNLYVLDSDNSRVLVLSKEGVFKEQYSSPQFESATSLAVSSGESEVFLVSSEKLYRFSL